MEDATVRRCVGHKLFEPTIDESLTIILDGVCDGLDVFWRSFVTDIIDLCVGSRWRVVWMIGVGWMIRVTT